MPRCNKDIPARLKRAEGCSEEIHVPCRRTKGLGSAPPRIFYQTVASTRYCLLPVLVMHARESNHDFLYQVSLNTETTMKKIKDNNALLFMVDLKANKKKINAVK